MANQHAKVKTIPPLIPLVAITISWILNEYIYALSIPIDIPYQDHIIHFFMFSALAIFGFSLFFFIKFKQNPEPHTPTNSLYTTGIYRLTRNPIYLGFLFAQVVVAIKFNNLYMIISIPVIMYLLTILVIKPEEEYLEQLFAQEYIDYKNKVRRWI